MFALFGAGSGAGWVFDAACDRVAVGAVVTMRAPLGGEPPALLGRIVGLRPPARVDVRLDQPRQGRLRVLFDRDGSATRVRVVADLDRDGMAWLMRRRGYRVPEAAPADDHPLGLLTSKSGSGSVFAAATENLVRMAAREVDADGGVRGRPLRIVVGDDGTGPATGAAEAWRLVRAGCRTVLAVTTSATFARAAAELRPAGVLLVQPVMNEGGLGGELRVQLDERPDGQLGAAAAARRAGEDEPRTIARECGRAGGRTSRAAASRSPAPRPCTWTCSWRRRRRAGSA